MTDERAYDYCKLCRFNHQQGWKHVYSRKHKSTVDFILQKFFKKVKDAMSLLEQPIIERVGYETGAQCWCYCCTCEVMKHASQDGGVIKMAGFIEHLASPSHRLKLDMFWKNHKVTRNDIQSFVVSSEQMDSFLKRAEDALLQHTARLQHAVSQEAQRIQATEDERQRILAYHKTKSTYNQEWAKRARITDCSVKNGSVSVTNVQGSRVTFIGRASSNPMGNVHSGGVPPWLQGHVGSQIPAESQGHDPGSEASTSVIGPTLEDFLDHKKQERKRKLPPDRVGGSNELELSATGPSTIWLPSFGGVWNRGRRESSKQQFLRRHASQSANPKQSHVHSNMNERC